MCVTLHQSVWQLELPKQRPKGQITHTKENHLLTALKLEAQDQGTAGLVSAVASPLPREEQSSPVPPPLFSQG